MARKQKRRESLKNWWLNFRVFPHNVQDQVHGRNVRMVTRDWEKITRSDAMAKAFRALKRSLATHPAKHPRFGTVFLMGRRENEDSFTTTIRLKHSFRRLEEIKDLTPQDCFVIGHGPRAWSQVTKR